jgi:ABC-type ATPase with predicted acetyltransferase domain
MSLPASHPTPAAPSERLCRAAAIFGLALDPPAPDRAPSPLARALRLRAARAAQRLDTILRPGQVAFVTGPSGAGKSLLLAALRDRLGPRAIGTTPPGPVRARRALVDLDPAPLPEWLATLARAGLSEASLLTRPYLHLSEGQKRRADLALAMARASRRAAASGRAHTRTLIADEFASPLDRTTALGLARTLRRWVLASSAGPTPRHAPLAPVRAVVATAHDDLLEALRPHVLVHVPLDAPPEILTP